MNFKVDVSNIPDIPLYIRFGDIPENEKSSVHYRNYNCGEEPGVSVYDCIIKNGQLNICIPYPWGEGINDTFWTFMEYKTEKPVYLVTGTEIGRGADNEPLIINVKILQSLTEAWLSDLEQFDHDRHETLCQRAEDMGWLEN